VVCMQGGEEAHHPPTPGVRRPGGRGRHTRSVSIVTNTHCSMLAIHVLQDWFSNFESSFVLSVQNWNEMPIVAHYVMYRCNNTKLLAFNTPDHKAYTMQTKTNFMVGLVL